MIAVGLVETVLVAAEAAGVVEAVEVGYVEAGSCLNLLEASSGGWGHLSP